MNAIQKTAKVTGILFILATAAGLAGSAVMGPALEAPDFLSTLSTEGNRVMVAALLSFAAACLSAGIAIALYPVLRRHSEGLALGAVGFRLIEAVFYTVGALCLLLLLALSRQSAGATGQDAYFSQSLGQNFVLLRMLLSDDCLRSDTHATFISSTASLDQSNEKVTPCHALPPHLFFRAFTIENILT